MKRVLVIVVAEVTKVGFVAQQTVEEVAQNVLLRTSSTVLPDVAHETHVKCIFVLSYLIEHSACHVRSTHRTGYRISTAQLMVDPHAKTLHVEVVTTLTSAVRHSLIIFSHLNQSRQGRRQSVEGASSKQEERQSTSQLSSVLRLLSRLDKQTLSLSIAYLTVQRC